MITTTNKRLTFAAIFLVLVMCFACHNYYMAKEIKKANVKEKATSLDSLRLQSRYFILRYQAESYAMKDIRLSEDQLTLTCTLDSLSLTHKLHLVGGRKGKMQYQKNKLEDQEVLNEVHLYAENPRPQLGNYVLPLDRVSKIEVLQKDRKRTTSSYVVGALGYTLGALVVAGVIIAATKSSCPFVSGMEGDQYTLQGEIYGGAIYPQLARHDYLPLRLSPAADNTLRVKISNELKERQYTDIAELWVINHKRHTRVIPDKDGNLYSISDPISPVSASLGNKRDVRVELAAPGDSRVLYFDDTSSSTGRNDLSIRFSKSPTQKKGNLLLSLKNSYFLDHLYGQLAKGLGTYYASYVHQQQNRPAVDLLKWVKDQQIPLEVSVKSASGWKLVTDLNTIGPLANRQVVVPIDLGDVNGDDVEVRLSSGFMFWEIDAVSMDYGRDDDFCLTRLMPISAKDELGRDVRELLVSEDGRYLDQPEIGNTATLAYAWQAPTDPSEVQSFVFHSKGYYEHIREFQGKPDMKFLERFTHPNAFPVFAMEQWRSLRKEALSSMAVK